MRLIDYLTETNFVSSRKEAKQKFSQGAIKFVSITDNFTYRFKPTDLNMELEEECDSVEENYRNCKLRFIIVIGKRFKVYKEYK